MKNFKVLEYRVVGKDGVVENNPNIPKMTRRVARQFKNFMNVAKPVWAPYRIVEVRVTK